ncbi:hypothetical protein LINPERHAP2_LOCUS29564 [Linum perenne]
MQPELASLVIQYLCKTALKKFAMNDAWRSSGVMYAHIAKITTCMGNYHIARVDAARTCEPGDSIPMQDCTEEICHERCVEVFGSRVSPHCEDYNMYGCEGC